MSIRPWAYAAAVLFPLAVSAGDWAEWRGPERNGVSREKNLADKFTVKGDGGENVAWIQRLSGGRSTPIVLKGKVYVNTATNHRITVPAELVQLQDKVTCFDAATGKIDWEDNFPIFLTDIPNIRIGWASMCGDTETGNVYVHTSSSILRCYTGDGKTVWERSLGEEFGEITGYGGRIQTPIIDENRLIVSFSGVNWGDFKGPPPSHLFLAFDKKNGKLLWMTSTTGPVNETTYSCPVVAVIDGVRQLVFGGADGSVHGIAARSGEMLWTYKFSKIGLNSSVAVDGDLVYACHGQDDVANGGMGRIQCFRAKGRGDITKAPGVDVWKADHIKAGYTSPCIYDGIVYIIDDGGKLLAYDAKTGKQYWKYNLGRVGKGSPVAADGKLFLTEVNGNIHIIPAGKTKPKALSTVRLWSLTSESEDEIVGSPAISDGRIFFATRDRLICVSDKNKQVTSDPVPPLTAEKPASGKPTSGKMYPFELTLGANSSAEFTTELFDENGIPIPSNGSHLTDVRLMALPGCTFKDNKLTVGEVKTPLAGEITGNVSGVAVKARVRVFPPLPWTFDFEGAAKGPPATWLQSTGRLAPDQQDGSTVIKKNVSRGKPGGIFFFGRGDMTAYTIQCDVKADRSKAEGEDAMQMSDVGLVNSRVALILRGNTQRLHIESWLAHKDRLGNGVPFEWKPSTWYTMKFRVDQKDGQAELKGKVWPRGQPEPEAWTISVVDPKPSISGCPGIFYFSLADSYYDNVMVTKNE